MKQLSKQGLGMQRRSAAVISEEQENELWNKRILGTEMPQMLLDTLLYTLGLHFALRAGQEHRALRVGENGQITVKRDLQNRRYLEYHEDVSKANRGGIQHRKIQPKITRAYENIAKPERCPVNIYEKYISLRPRNCKTDALYLRPLKAPTAICWYCDSPVGVHVLQQTVGNLCKRACFNGHYTNNSLRATAATRLYEAGIDEQLITEKTGHRSNAVRGYKRTSEDQLMQVSGILHGQSDQSKKSKTENFSSDTGSTFQELNLTSGSMSLHLKFTGK